MKRPPNMRGFALLDWIRGELTGEPNTGCHLWTGRHAPNGYGQMRYLGKWIGVHRLVYCLAAGVEPDEIQGLQVRHKCDVRCCANLSHLIVGTHADNMQDKIDRDRNHRPRGMRHPGRKLNESDVYCVRADERPYPVIASEYGISPATVCNIKKRKSWSHLPEVLA